MAPFLAPDPPASRAGPTWLNRERSRQVSVRSEHATAEDDTFLRPCPQVPIPEHHCPKPTKINHPKRTISSAQQYFRRNAPENFFRPNHPTTNLTQPPTGRSPGADHRRTGSNRTEQHRTPERSISSAQRHFRRKTAKNSVPPNTRPRSAPNPSRPFTGPRSSSNRIERDRTAPNAQSHDLQRSATLPPQDAEKLRPPEHQTAKRPQPPADRSPGPDHRRPGSNRTEHHRTPKRTISSAQRHFRRNTPENLCAPNAPIRRRQPTACCPREA